MMTLDLEALLAAISGDDPTGPNLREEASGSSTYHALRDIRTHARNKERAARANGDSDYIDSNDWMPLIETAPKILQEQSKDIEIVAWLIEALTRTQGFNGFSVGFQLARLMIEKFGEKLHPRPDEDGKATQLAALIGLNGYGSEGALISPLKFIPLTEGTAPAPFSTWQCEQAFELERISDPAKRDARSKRGFTTRAEVDQAITETSQDFLIQTHKALLEARAQYDRYQNVLDSYCEDQPQPTGRIKDTLDACLQALTYIAADRIAANRSSPDTSDPEGTDSHEPSDTNVIEPDTAQLNLDRSRALAQLVEIADFFRRSEPHSPISYAIEKAVYWSRLSLPELLNELITDENARQTYQTLTGIRTTK